MRKKCVICGIDIDETVTVCPKCGTQKPTENPEFKVIPKQTPTVSKKAKGKVLPFILGGGAVALIAVVILLVCLFGGTPTPEPSAPPTLIDNSLALMNGNLDVLEQMAPDEYWEFVAQNPFKKTKDEYLSMRKEDYTKYFNDRDKQYDSFVVTGEIISEADMNETTLQKTAEILFTDYGIPENSVTAGKELTVQWAVTTSDKTWKTPPEVLSGVEINGIWYLVYRTDEGNYSELDFYKFSKYVKNGFVQ